MRRLELNRIRREVGKGGQASPPPGPDPHGLLTQGLTEGAPEAERNSAFPVLWGGGGGHLHS